MKLTSLSSPVAAADRGLPHEIVSSMMISSTDAYGESWDLIDDIPDERVCMSGILPNQAKAPLPTLLHVSSSLIFGTLFCRH